MREVVVLALAFGAVVASGCRDPTQITLTLHTNAACSDVAGTAISVGGPDEVESLAPVATTSTCTPDPDGGEIGSLVLVPANADDAAVGVKVTLSVGDTLETCLAPPYDDCIVARRSLRYIAHSPLTLPVDLSLDCQGKFCDALTTCIGGVCVDAQIDPNACIAPSGCRPAPPDGGAGGAGGAGGGAASCGTPASQPEEQLDNAGSQRTHLVIAADPSTCGWAVAWAEGGTACLQRVGANGKASGIAVCRALDAVVDDVAVATLGDGAFAIAAWSATATTAQLWAVQPDAKTSQTPPITGVVGGALAARDDVIVMLNEHVDGSLQHRTYTWSASLMEDAAGTLGANGQRPHVAWSGEDLMVSWLSNPSGTQGGYVARLSDGNWTTTVDGAVGVAAVSEIVIANHEPGDVAGITFLDTGGVAELATWDPLVGYATGQYAANDYSATSTSFSIAGTTTGWVIGFVDQDRGWVTPFTDGAMNIGPQQQVATNATSVAVAAIGDQLAVTWIDSGANLHFRLIEASLAGL